MSKSTYLTDVNDIFAKDLQNPDFSQNVQAEKNKLASAVAVREAREAYGWTQSQLADRAGIPQSTVARVEAGSNTSMDTISKIATAFGKRVQISFS
ncbi:MAG: helix-turn-helix transcriptional regulator [Lactobacillus sp.]|jgi:DNA-binding XRE family transcriptional regulator|nr:helix-turn-helix transcriptional regulator [Lactobacillus sp.]